MPPAFHPASRDSFTAALLRHFDGHRRAMPWRATGDPYAIWVSEVMLQQTRVDTVIPYWERWMERFPSVERLADADLDDVLVEWEGLGYYSRARNLHAAARVVRERHGGRLPSEPDGLRELPGVGEYTAGAVASIAFGVATPAVDGNVRRVLSRIYDLARPSHGEIRERAAALVPDDRPGDFNQALMELGATVCTPRSPDCGVCPVRASCAARARGVQELRPLPKPRKTVPEEAVRTIVLSRQDGALLLVRRPEEGLLARLWEFPGEPLPPDLAALCVHEEVELPAVSHTFSHKRIHYRPVLRRVSVEGSRSHGAADRDSGVAWVDAGALDAFALPVAQRRIAKLALASLGSGSPPVDSARPETA